MKKPMWKWMLLLCLLWAACDDDDDDNGTNADNTVSITTTEWTAAQAGAIARTNDNTIPSVTENGKVVTPGYHNWDYWPLLNMDGSIATVNGYQILFMLTAPETVLSGKRHDIATIRYAISSDNENWQDMGNLFPEQDRLGSRNWAGSCFYDEEANRVWVFYTATGIKGESVNDLPSGTGGGGSGATAGEGISYDQRIAMTSANLVTSGNALQFSNWTTHQEVLQADGAIYAPATGQDATGTVYAFRDPWLYQHPSSGKFYLLFTVRSAGGADTFDGAIGIAESTNDDFTGWTLLPPLVSTSINSELERPHIVREDGRYYLFFSTHREKFAPPYNEDSPEGLYGFSSNRLGGPYEPLNGSALVAANPANDPYMTFSWQVLPGSSVISNVNYYNVGPDIDVAEFGNLGEAWDREHFGGTLAPILQLDLSGNETRITGTDSPGLP